MKDTHRALLAIARVIAGDLLGKDSQVYRDMPGWTEDQLADWLQENADDK